MRFGSRSGDHVSDLERRVLCFGDSNTWGLDPATRLRISKSGRWTGVLQAQLEGRCEVVEEGLRGRTAAFEDPLGVGRNGAAAIEACLLTHQPLELVIIMLGTNDLKDRFNASVTEIGIGLGRLLGKVRAMQSTGPGDLVPAILVVAPPPLGKLSTALLREFSKAYEKSRLLGPEFAKVAMKSNCHFFDAFGVISTGDIDGVHFPAVEHAKLGRALAARVLQLGMWK